jgi:hypothetical protein
MTTSIETLTGEVERIVYSGDETGYTVCRLNVCGRPELVRAVGVLPDVQLGEQLILRAGQAPTLMTFAVQSTYVRGWPKYHSLAVVSGVRLARRAERSVVAATGSFCCNSKSDDNPSDRPIIFSDN